MLQTWSTLDVSDNSLHHNVASPFSSCTLLASRACLALRADMMPPLRGVERAVSVAASLPAGVPGRAVPRGRAEPGVPGRAEVSPPVTDPGPVPPPFSPFFLL